MTARTYDYSVVVDNISGFYPGRSVIGRDSATIGVIAAVDIDTRAIKIRLANTMQEYRTGEVILSNLTATNSTANSSLTTTSLPFQASTYGYSYATAAATIQNITPSTYNSQKNAFTQNPIVRLYSIYYPGEWYPINENGNPSNDGEGKSWPNDFPIRFAEIIGDVADDLQYNVSMGSTTYMPFPVQSSGLEQGADGKISDVTLTVYNVDNIISGLVENPHLAGNNASNSVMAIVNGELVHGIDPRTVSVTPIQLGAPGSTPYSLLQNARTKGLLYNEDIVNYYGKTNAPFDKHQTESLKGKWVNYKGDSRDLLGAVVEIKTTFANFLDFWPEYSLITTTSGNTVYVKNTVAYRVGDKVTCTTASEYAIITALGDNNSIILDRVLSAADTDKPLYIVNEDAEPTNYMKDVLKVDQLEGLSEHVAKFGLVSWLQYFKMVTPKRKYYKNTCQWKYKDENCQYPGPGGLPIPNTGLVSSPTSIGIDNNAVSTYNTPILNTSSWRTGDPAGLSNFIRIGPNNYIGGDSTPYGEVNNVWDITTMGAPEGGVNGGWYTNGVRAYPGNFLRVSCWIRQRVLKSGTIHVRTEIRDGNYNYSQLRAINSGATHTYAVSHDAGLNELDLSSWYLFVYHLWPSTTGITSNYYESGVYDVYGNKVRNCTDFVLPSNTFYLYNLIYKAFSTDNWASQQMYGMRIDDKHQAHPSISDLLTYTDAQLLDRSGLDICGKSLKSCELRNNSVHFGGFPGVGRTVPKL